MQHAPKCQLYVQWQWESPDKILDPGRPHSSPTGNDAINLLVAMSDVGRMGKGFGGCVEFIVLVVLLGSLFSSLSCPAHQSGHL
jgi:hypothetical protein